MINEEELSRVILKYVLKSRYITDEEADNIVEVVIDEIIEDATLNIDYLIREYVDRTNG